MNPVSPVIEGVNEIRIAENQREYNTLPAIVTDEGQVISRWCLSWRERMTVLFEGNIFLSIWTSGRSVQPVNIDVHAPVIPSPRLSSVDILKERSDGLNYLSDSDDLWRVFAPTARRNGDVTCDTIRRITGRLCIARVDFDAWFEHTIRSQTISQGKEVGARYEALRYAMIELLADRQVFRMSGTSPFNLETYVVGIDYQNNLVGVFAGSTET